jgi:hypothetical protein
VDFEVGGFASMRCQRRKEERRGEREGEKRELTTPGRGGS